MNHPFPAEISCLYSDPPLSIHGPLGTKVCADFVGLFQAVYGSAHVTHWDNDVGRKSRQ